MSDKNKKRNVVTRTLPKCAECNKHAVMVWGGCWNEDWVCDCVDENGKQKRRRLHAGRCHDMFIDVSIDSADFAQGR